MYGFFFPLPEAKKKKGATQSIAHATLYLEVVSSSPMLTQNLLKKKKRLRLCLSKMLSTFILYISVLSKYLKVSMRFQKNTIFLLFSGNFFSKKHF